MPKLQGNLRHAPVVKGIFKGLGHALVLVIGQYKAVFTETVQAEFRIVRACNQRLESVLVVKAGEAAGNGIGNDGSAVIAYHAVGFIAGELPDGQFSGFVVDGEHAPYEIHRALRLNFHKQRMKPPEGIPEGENGVAFPAFGLMDFSVHTTVFPVYV